MVFDPYIEMRRTPMRKYITPSDFDQFKQFLTYDKQVRELVVITRVTDCTCYRNPSFEGVYSLIHSKKPQTTQQAPDFLLGFSDKQNLLSFQPSFVPCELLLFGLQTDL